ncbi:MAG: hypothetical protein ACOY4D_09950 [Pseudomonadota bacterium]
MKDDDFLQQARHTLRASEQHLDRDISARLVEARYKALATPHLSRPGWIVPLALAASMLLALGLWLTVPDTRFIEQTAETGVLDDMALLTSQADPELYDELEFYLWLEKANEPG